MSEAQSRPAALSRCFLPNWLMQRRAWGISVQLYELRSARNWGIGDFQDLAEFALLAGEAGAEFVGLNPLHALFMAEPYRRSPFSPSNRRFLNPLYIAVDLVEDFEPAMADEAKLEQLRAVDLVDYPGVAEAKLSALKKIWQKRKPKVAAPDPQLRLHALFEALSLDMVTKGHGAGWLSWPEEFHDPNSAAVKKFATASEDEITFHVWLQQLAREQLESAGKAAKAAGMRIGLYLDFAVGEAPDGSATWGDRELSVRGVSVGAPPDVFTAAGQDWGLAPLAPDALAANDFAAYRELMAAAARNAGALRIDHAMSLRQLFWIPVGRPAAEGAYVQYPLEGTLAALAELSNAQEMVVIGEDLGHVPEGFRDTMAAAHILSYRILYFEKRGQRFIAPKDWPSLALACLSTHDLPTLKGWWAGDDISLRAEYGLISQAAAALQRRERRAERRNLLEAFARAGLLSRRDMRALLARRTLDDVVYARLAIAAHRYIARTPGRLTAMRLADAVGEFHPTNLPGTSDEYPNWQRKLDVPQEQIRGSALFGQLTAALRRERPA